MSFLSWVFLVIGKVSSIQLLIFFSLRARSCCLLICQLICLLWIVFRYLRYWCCSILCMELLHRLLTISFPSSSGFFIPSTPPSFCFFLFLFFFFYLFFFSLYTSYMVIHIFSSDFPFFFFNSYVLYIYCIDFFFC